MVFVNLHRNGCLLHFGRAKNRDCKLDFMTYRIIAEAFLVTGNLYERQVVLKKKRKLGVAPMRSDYRDFILDC
ncbi:hypothetical protein Bca52824_058842 [Brassica carinata]|uniref:Uncharacterized protein n=1 Tax=Brassica carinata TaxID=52824 RepID=A0A8X7UEZ9_BRACI|nr:hypothetical protein Bca52824_058842 [Brassica carinata]